LKMRFKRKDGEITKVTLVSENEGDRELIDYLWNHGVSREKKIYRPGYVVLQAKVKKI